MATINSICKYNKFGFCKFLTSCRNYHVNEKCQEISCENRTCLKRHPKICKYFELYNRCKFGEYCAFEHRENPLLKEINKLNIKCGTLEGDLNDKLNEVFDLRKKVEALEQVLEEVVIRVETITTPTKKGSTKRRRVKQTVTPSPTHKAGKAPEHPVEVNHAPGEKSQTDQDQSDEDITAEEIMRMYESND